MSKEEFLRIFPQSIRSKADALRYALELTMTFSGGNFELNLGHSKEIYQFFCENVDLPDFADCGCCGECKPPITEEELQNKENAETNPKLAQGYCDVARELFDNGNEFYEPTGENGRFYVVNLSNQLSSAYSHLNCTSRKQAGKLLAINKLMNVAKYLNGDWKPDFINRNELKWYIYIDEDGEFDTAFQKEWITTSVYFKSQELAEKAIEILSPYELGLALSTDY